MSTPRVASTISSLDEEIVKRWMTDAFHSTPALRRASGVGPAVIGTPAVVMFSSQLSLGKQVGWWRNAR